MAMINVRKRVDVPGFSLTSCKIRDSAEIRICEVKLFSLLLLLFIRRQVAR